MLRDLRPHVTLRASQPLIPPTDAAAEVNLKKERTG